MVLNGNDLNRNIVFETNPESLDTSRPFMSFKKAQTTVRAKKEDATKDDYVALCSLLLRNNLENWTHGRDPINNTAQIVDKWARLVKAEDMKMDTGLTTLVKRVVADPRTKTIYFFKKSGMQALLIVVDKVDPDIELEYSGYYVDCLRAFKDFYCDFMVYSLEEIKQINVPSNAETIYQSGEANNA